ncbi:MAG: PDZ domain-containing protein [Planctomycetes bacterium]|nr:PDZ domain-containing protein [Planctomycetota bacterium]
MKYAFAFASILAAILISQASGITAYGQDSKTASREDIQKLVIQLGDNDPEIRDQTTKRLMEIGEPAKAELEKAVKSDDPEVSWRATKILEAIKPADSKLSEEQTAGQPLRPQGHIRISPNINIQSNGYSITKDSTGKITLSLTEKDENGKPAIKTYTADNVEEFMKKYPEIAEKYGINKDSFSDNDFSFQFKQDFDENLDDVLKDFHKKFNFNRDFGNMDDLEDFLKHFDDNFKDFDDMFNRQKSLKEKLEEMLKNKRRQPQEQPQETPRRAPAPAIQTGVRLCNDFGADFASVDEETRTKFGLPAVNGITATNMRKNGTAKKIGLLENDVVMSVNGQEVNSYLGFRRLLCENLGSDSVTLNIIRDKKSQIITVKMELLMEY